MNKDLKTNLGIVDLLSPIDTAGTDAVSLILDCANVESPIINLLSGLFTGVDGSNYLTPILQESDTIVGTSFTAVAAADIQGAFVVINSTSLDNLIQTVQYKGSKRYIRVNLDFTGSGITASLNAVLAIIGNAKYEPVVAPDPITAT